MDESKQRKYGTILSYISIIANTLIGLLYTPFLIKMLGQSEYGLYSLANSVIGYLTVLDLGFGNAIIVYTAKYRAQKKYDEEKKLHGMFKIVFIIIGFLSMLLGLALYFNTEKLFGNTMSETEIYKTKIMMLILTFNLGISFWFSIYTSIINAYEKFVYQKIISIVGTILKPLIMIPLLFLGYKSIEMTIVITLVNVLLLFSNYYYCNKKIKVKVKYKGFDKTVFKIILSYSIWLFLSSVVDKINWNVDQFILGAVSGTIAVSIYSIAGQLNTLVSNLSTAVSGVFLPKMSKMVANGATSKELTNEFVKVGRIQFYIVFLIITGFALVGKEFIIWWVGEEFLESYYVTLCLIIPQLFTLIQNLGLSIMQAMNKFKFKALSTFFMAIFNVFISILLAKQYGAIGAALGTTLSIVLCNIILINIYYYKVIKLNIIEFWKNIFIMILKSSIPLILIYILIYFTNLTGMGAIIVYGGIYTMLFLLICYYFVMNDYEKNIVKSFLKKRIKEK